MSATSEAIATPVDGPKARAGRFKAAQLLPRLAVVAGAVPGLWLIGRALLGDLGAEPVSELLNRFGLFAVWLLIASLACTPAQLISGQGAFLLLRKPLGLWAFAWGLLHGLTYVVIDQGLDFQEIVASVIKRPFITLGALALLLLLPLALTSTQRAMKRLGYRNWKRLHRLAYVAAGLACVHYFLRFKLPEATPIAAGILLAVLLLLRLWLRRARSAAGAR